VNNKLRIAHYPELLRKGFLPFLNLPKNSMHIFYNQNPEISYIKQTKNISYLFMGFDTKGE
jgi:hypothetical protein